MFMKFQIVVQDFGCGIPPDKLASLFINFQKIEETSAMNRRGVGLGLSICKALIEQMGGSVAVESELGVGTKFVITLNSHCKVRKLDLINISKRHLQISSGDDYGGMSQSPHAYSPSEEKSKEKPK
jgi:hypothetical protein